jgi:hypothetical protein
MKVGSRIVHAGNPLPSLPDAYESLLGEFLGFMLVSRNQSERAIESEILCREE